MSRPVESCCVEIRVRYAETDAMGYLHHAQYPVYFEIGRTELLRQNGIRYRELEEQGLFYVVAKLECRFKLPARYDDLLRLETRTTRLTPVRVEHGYRLFHDDQLLTEASTTLVSVGREGRPIPLPEPLYARLTGVTKGGVGD
jgi:acyl-CoA thioester hydrolase